MKLRGCSSVGRASVLHAEGQRFDSAHLHQKRGGVDNKLSLKNESYVLKNE